MTLAARLALQTGAPIVLAWCERLPRRQRLPPAPEPAGRAAARRGEDAQALQVAQAEVINRAMERLILQCPQQYLWGYNRYKGPRNADAAAPAPDAA